MKAIRGGCWFVALAVLMACWMGVLGSFRGTALAGVIPSHGAEGMSIRDADLGKVQAFLEQKIVLQKLADYGVPPQEAMAKIRSMSNQDLHRLASLTDRAAEGTDSGIGILIGIAVLAILIIVIIKLMNKEIIIR